MDDRRKEGRFLCADLVRLDWVDGDAESGSEQALLEDISALGACVQMDHPLPLGATVMLSMGATPFYGSVNYCTWRDDGYFIGLRFCDDSKWSAGLVRPDHLLSLTDLAARFGN